MKSASTITTCATVTALSVVLMFFGGTVFIFAYLVPMFVGLFMIMLKTTFGSPAAWVTYVSVSLLTFMLVNDKECMLIYVFIFGYYAIIQSGFEKIKPKVFRIFAKFVFFNLMFALSQIVLVYLFHIPFMDETATKVIIVLFVILMNFLFFLYDKLVLKTTYLYKIKIEKRIKKLFKK